MTYLRKSQICFTTGGLPAISSSWRQAPESHDQYSFQLNLCGYSPYVTFSLTIGWVSIVYNCCWFSPAQSFSGPSPVGLMTIFYCLMFDTPPTWRARSPYLYPPGTGWPSFIPRHWVPFSSPPTTPTVEISEPASTWEGQLHQHKAGYINKAWDKSNARVKTNIKELRTHDPYHLCQCTLSRLLLSELEYCQNRSHNWRDEFSVWYKFKKKKFTLNLYWNWGCLKTGCWGEYLDPRKMKWGEVGGNCIMRSFITCTLLQV
jgi:hypothetical protein